MQQTSAEEKQNLEPQRAKDDAQWSVKELNILPYYLT